MKIQIDTTAKTLKLDEAVQMGELINSLKMLFPNGEWKEFQLITNVVVNWQTNPIIIRDWSLHPTYPNFPWWQQPYYTTCGTSSAGYKLTQGTFDIQI